MQKRSFDPSKIRHLGTVNLPDHIDRMVVQKMKEADEDIQEMRMQVRWSKSQIAVLKKAAAIIGIPYQTYAKQTLWQQAIKDIKDAEKYGKVSDQI